MEPNETATCFTQTHIEQPPSKFPQKKKKNHNRGKVFVRIKCIHCFHREKKKTKMRTGSAAEATVTLTHTHTPRHY